ncbi:MAG: ABC transporter permease [Gemmatimonadaceae bacterium]
MRMLLAWMVAAIVTALLSAALRRSLRDTGGRGGPWRSGLARLRADRASMLALYTLVALVVVAALANRLAPYDPSHPIGNYIELQSRPPSRLFPFGTDQSSRDIFSRVLFGARISLGIAVLAMLLSLTVGTAYGALAGYAGGIVDAVMARALDAALATPRILILLAALSVWGQVSVGRLIVLLGLTGWFDVSRMVRAQVLALRDDDVAIAARALGASAVRTVTRHVLPRVLSPVLASAALNIASLIALEAGLSYLGIGTTEGTSWGSIIYDGSDAFAERWWISLFPGLAIATAVVAFNVLGDGLRDALDPRQLFSR